jgi:hypothetical protein
VGVGGEAVVLHVESDDFYFCPVIVVMTEVIVVVDEV